jgi:hypothetical protein
MNDRPSASRKYSGRASVTSEPNHRSITGIPVGQSSPTAAPLNTNSICAFSGLNHFHAGEPGELPIRTQSYGQLVRAGLKAEFPSPGVACNGHSGFLSGG